MIFFRAKKLADKLHRDEVPQWQFVIYAIVFILFFAIGVVDSIFILIEQLFKSSDIAIIGSNIWILVLTFFGLLALAITFKINTSGDGKDFSKRFVCLYLPIVTQVSLITIPLLIFAFITLIITLGPIERNQGAAGFSKSYTELLNLVDTMFLSATVIASYTIPQFYGVWLYMKSFKIASGQEGYKS